MILELFYNIKNCHTSRLRIEIETQIASTILTMTGELDRADNDSAWKEILEAYFPQAM